MTHVLILDCIPSKSNQKTSSQGNIFNSRFILIAVSRKVLKFIFKRLYVVNLQKSKIGIKIGPSSSILFQTIIIKLLMAKKDFDQFYFLIISIASYAFSYTMSLIKYLI